MCTPENDDIYINADSATSKELEFDASIDFSHVNLYANANRSDRETTMGSFTTNKTALPSLYGKLGFKFFGESNIIGQYWIDSYLRAASNAQVQESITDDIINYADWGTLNLAFGNDEVTNLTDKAYTQATQSLLEAGLSVHAKFSIEF